MIDLLALEKLDGKNVLVRSSRDHRTPPIALRGSLKVDRTSAKAGTTDVKLVLNYPDMFTAPAHQVVISLDVAEVSRLLASSEDEPYALTLPIDLEAEARDQSLVAPSAGQPK